MRLSFTPGLLLLTTGALVAAPIGCGPPKVGTVIGKVSFKDAPLPGGTVSFISEDDRTVLHSPIGSDGSYTITAIPVGTVKIAVATQAPPPKGMAMPGMVPEEGRYVPIPVQYRDPTQSGLRYAVAEGQQTHDIQLKP